MAFSTCLFCKRTLDDFCYSIYDECNQPVLNILQLFGDVEAHLRNDRCICYECLYVIRWIYFMKKVLKEALLDEDIGENDKVIAAFNIFKVKMNQPIFLLDEENSGDENENNLDDENEVSHSNIEYLGSSSGSDVEIRGPLDLTQKCDSANTRRRKSRKKRVCRPPPGTKPGQHFDCCVETDWTSSGSCIDDEEYRLTNVNNGCIAEYACTIKVCEHCCDTFEELRRHQEEDHLVELSGFTQENYEKQLQELCKANHIDITQRKKFRCFLSDCRKVYKTVELLANHKITDHNLLAKFWCDKCNNMPFSSQLDLNQHTCTLHNNMSMDEHSISTMSILSCHDCDKSLDNVNLHKEQQQQLNNHKKYSGCSTSLTDNSTSSTFIKKSVTNKDKNNCNNGQDKRGLCSFKIRLQQISPVKKPETHMKWLGSKYPNFSRECLMKKDNETTKENESDKKIHEKVEISLPPRKRRLYHVAHQIETYSGNLSMVNKMDTPVIVPLSIGTGTELMGTQQPKIAKAIESVPSSVLIESRVKPIETVEEQDQEQSQKATTISKDSIHVVSNVKDEDTADLGIKLQIKPATIVEKIVTNEVESSIESPPKKEIPLSPMKTRHSRKRKKVRNPFTHIKKKIPDIKLQENQKSLNNDVNNEPKTLAKEGAFPYAPVISKIEENANKTNPGGRITMKISLKAIEQYKHSKESKRKKKLKGRKKNKLLMLPKSKTIIANNENASTSTIRQDNCIILEKQHSLDEQEYQIQDDLIQEHVIETVIEEHAECDQSLFLNKDEINRIILGESPCPTKNIQTRQKVKKQLDNTVFNGHSFSIPMLTEPVKSMSSPRSSRGRKIKRKPGTIMHIKPNKPLKPKKKVKNITCVPTTVVDSQIANVLLSDHVYAKSAFNEQNQDN